MKTVIRTFSVMLLSVPLVLCSSGSGADELPQKFQEIVAAQKPDSVEAKKPLLKIADIPLPDGYQRVAVQEGSFGAYLRNFPLNAEDNTVYLYDGSEKMSQGKHLAVLDIDIGKRDLQQCADAVMRLRGEYLYAKGAHDQISFDFVSGKKAGWKSYAKGDYSAPKFRKYMDYVFSYANTRSLFHQMNPVKDEINDIQVGDSWIQTGNPYGHAMLVMDVAEHTTTGKRIFLLAQSYMPAQSVHVVLNFTDNQLNPWYPADWEKELDTPSWTFYRGELRRF